MDVVSKFSPLILAIVHDINYSANGYNINCIVCEVISRVSEYSTIKSQLFVPVTMLPKASVTTIASLAILLLNVNTIGAKRNAVSSSGTIESQCYRRFSIKDSGISR